MTRCAIAGLLFATAATAALAAAPSSLDGAPTGITPMAPVSVGSDSPISAPRAAQRPRGNPLWGVPLSVLSATRERPIFLPSRRPIAPVVATPQPVTAPAAAVPEPEQPRLTLVGAVVRDGEEEAIAIFIDQAGNSVIRLRTGQKHGGWELTAVRGRSATFQKGGETLTITLPAPGAGSMQPASTGVAAIPAVVPVQNSVGVPTAATADGMVVPDASVAAPFVPRSAPKNGEPDGL